MPQTLSAASSRRQPASSRGLASARPRANTAPSPRASVRTWIAESSAVMSTAQSSAISVLCFLCVLRGSTSPPCAACIVLAVPASELRDAPAIDIPIAVVIPIDVSDAALAGALSSIGQTRAAFIVDAREAGHLSDEQQ